MKPLSFRHNFLKEERELEIKEEDPRHTRELNRTVEVSGENGFEERHGHPWTVQISDVFIVRLLNLQKEKVGYSVLIKDSLLIGIDGGKK